MFFLVHRTLGDWAGSLSSLTNYIRRSRSERAASRRRVACEARVAAVRLFREWTDAIDELGGLPDAAWSNPAYAPALLRERAAFRTLAATLRTARQDTLPE